MSTFQDVPCQDIDEPLLATRFPTGDDGLVELAQSIDSLGLLQPVVLVRMGERYRLVAGARRLAACRMLGWETIPANVLQVSHAGEYCATLAENLRRRALNPMEEARALAAALYVAGLTQAVLAQTLGLSQATISNRLRLLEMTPDLRGAVAKGNLVPSSALEIARIWDPQSQSYYLTLAVRQGAARNTVRDWVAAWLQYNEPSESTEETLSPANNSEPWPEPKPPVCAKCGLSLGQVDLCYLPFCLDCEQALKDAAKQGD